MISLKSQSLPHTTLTDPRRVGQSVVQAERLSVSFPGGECPVQCVEMNRHERAFALRYLRDIGLLVRSSPEKWEDWREMLADETCPVFEFDPEWFSFLLPPLTQTRMELFAWYWLWVESGGKLAVSRYAYCELSAAFEVACQPAEIWDGLSAVVSTANEALLFGDDAGLASVVSHDGDEDPRDRLDGSLIWFPRLIVDHEPSDMVGPVVAGEPETTVWGYLTTGEGGFDQVTGQIRARRSNGKWTLDSRPIRTYRPVEVSARDEALSAFSE